MALSSPAGLALHTRYTAAQARWRRYLSQRCEMGVAVGTVFLVAFAWGWLLAESQLRQWGFAPLLTWLTFPVLVSSGMAGWALALHWSSGWDEVWGARLTEARLCLSPSARQTLEQWCKDGRVVLERDVRRLQRFDRKARLTTGESIA